MKLLLSTPYSKTIFLIASICLPLCGPSIVEAGSPDPLSPGAVRPGLDYRTELSQGYLVVYSATDRFDDGGVLYYPHSSYSVYTGGGKLLKNVENHISVSDESPELVTLPVGSYTVEARSENEGYLRVHVVVSANRRTILNLDQEQADTQKKSSRAKNSKRLVVK
jgi:hypothetical protein